MQDILAGLRSLDSVHGTNQYEQLMEKLSAGSSDFMTGNQSVLIDLSSWYKDSLSPKIAVIRSAIDRHCKLKFVYYSPRGEQNRTVEPYYLIFRWSSWYVWGFCETRQDFRLFKLNRMDELEMTDCNFLPRTVPMPDLSNERVFPGGIAAKVLFDASCKWRIVEEFGADSFEIQQDGKLMFCMDYTNKENLLSWLMTFGDQAELLEPEGLRRELGETLRRMLQKYEKER